eukprot:COSAG05_NODE_10745_length_548_cov_1.349666_1_plen_182_part_11
MDVRHLRLAFQSVGKTVTEQRLAEILKTIGTADDNNIGFKQFAIACEIELIQVDDLTKAIQDRIFGASLVVDDDGEADFTAWCGLLYPESKTRVSFDIFQVGLLIWVLYVVPMRIAFAKQPALFSAGFWMDVFVDVMLVLDLIIQMYTYYQDGRTGHWVHNGQKIRARYFRGWFWVDFLAVI